MARRLKPYSLGFYEHPRIGGRWEYFLDRNTLDFFANFGNETVAAESKDALFALMKEKVEQSMSITWQPVIEVREVRPTTCYGETAPPYVCFSLRRYWHGYRSDGEHLRAQWSCDTDEKRNRNYQGFGWPAGKEFVLPYASKPQSNFEAVTYYMRYDEAAYNALRQLQENIQKKPLTGPVAILITYR